MKKSFRSCAIMSVLSVLIAAGCASAPSYRTHPGFSQRKNVIRSAGLLQPMISMYEEQFSFGMNKLVPHDDWSREAAESVRQAFINETAAGRLPLTVIDRGGRDENDLLDLFSAVDLSIQRHAYEKKSGMFPPREPFPEKLVSFDYSLGPVGELMERHKVDAIWIVTGFNLLTTTGAQAGDAAQHFIAILSALGGGPGMAYTLKKIELRAALVDKSGEIVFYTRLDESNVPYAEFRQYNAERGEQQIDLASEEKPVREDIRDPRSARRYIRALFSEYREATQ